ncbi:MAG TPA: hypothetical protein VJN90_11340 [Candidatus Acidoferrales bacterium]|nr:hypothetical protein [Candidatus Acidoferrales bacterium]
MRANIRDARRGHTAWTVIWIGLVAGTLDIAENIIFNHFRGVTMKMIFQYIGSGLIGMKSFTMGAASVALGVAIHYAIAMTWTVIFYLLSRKLLILTRRAAISGIVYGGVVYVVMNFIVRPLTAVSHSTKAISRASAECWHCCSASA